LSLHNFTTKTVLEFYPARRLSFASASARSLGALSHEPNLNPARQLSFASASARSLGARSREPNLNCHRSRPAPRARRSARSRHLSCSLSLALLCCSCSCSRSPACSPPRLRPLATSLASVAPLALARPRISPQAASVRPSASEIRPHVHKRCARTVCQKASKFDLPTGPPFCLAAFWRVLGGGQSRTKSSRQKNTHNIFTTRNVLAEFFWQTALFRQSTSQHAQPIFSESGLTKPYPRLRTKSSRQTKPSSGERPSAKDATDAAG